MAELSKLVRIITKASLAIGIVTASFLVVLFGLGYVRNNSDAPFPSRLEIEQSRNHAIGWFKAHESGVLDTPNPALWWMLRDSATLTGNSYLASLNERYYERYLGHEPQNVWHHLFDHGSNVWIPVYRLEDFPDYNLLFLYGLSCQDALRNDYRVLRLLKDNACGPLGTLGYFHDPACVTHQLMGMRFMQQRQCGDQEQTAVMVKSLQDRTAIQTTWDFRVVDFYIQRVLMLAESGSAQRIKARWLRRIIEAQRPDGGWDDFEEFLNLDTDRSVGWGGIGIRILRPESNFHTTAQGLYLMSLLAARLTGTIDDSPRMNLP